MYKRTPARTIAAALTVLVAITFVVVFARSPRADRDWDDDVAVLADIAIAPDETHFTIRHARDWRYSSGGVESRDRFAARYAVADLAGMSFYEQKLDPSGLIAHTFVVFEFDGEYAEPRLGVSVETRRERGETYSLLKGALRGFELMHTWASEADLVQRRVTYLGYELTKFPVMRPLAEQKRYLLRFLRDTIELRSAPQWYNTITSNCTNVVIGAANDIDPGFVPFDKSYVLTGLAAGYLSERGILADQGVVQINATNVDAYTADLR